MSNGIGDALYWSRGLDTIRMNETTLLSDGLPFVGWWWTPPIWKDPQPGRLAELNMAAIEYVSELDSGFFCSGSPDGGETWLEGKPFFVPTIEHHRGVRTAIVDFDYVQGHDPRFRICFTEPEIIIVTGFVAEFIVRGQVRYERLLYAT